MSTGYIFGDSTSLLPEIRERIRPLIIGSYLDRDIRLAIAEYFPWGIYFPEPNVCFLIARNQETLQWSFVESFGNENQDKMESLAIIKRIPHTRKIIFSNKPPLITSVPNRAVRNNKGSLLSFSISSRQSGGVITLNDFTQFGQITQTYYSVYGLGTFLSKSGYISGSGLDRTLQNRMAGIFKHKLDEKITLSDIEVTTKCPDLYHRLEELERGLNNAKEVVKKYKRKYKEKDFDTIFNSSNEYHLLNEKKKQFNKILDDHQRNLKKNYYLNNSIHEESLNGIDKLTLANTHTLLESINPEAARYDEINSIVETPQEALRYIDEEGTTHEFIAHQVDGTQGNCGFITLGVDRHTSVANVIRILNLPTDPFFNRVREVLINEMRENLAVNFPDQVELLNAYIPNLTEIQTYVRQTYDTPAWWGKCLARI